MYMESTQTALPVNVITGAVGGGVAVAVLLTIVVVVIVTVRWRYRNRATQAHRK